MQDDNKDREKTLFVEAAVKYNGFPSDIQENVYPYMTIATVCIDNKMLFYSLVTR